MATTDEIKVTITGNSDGLKKAVQDASKSVKDLTKNVASLAPGGANAVVGVSNAFNSLKGVANGVFKNISTFAGSTWNNIKQGATHIASNSPAFSKLSSVASSTFNTVKSAADVGKNAISGIGSVVSKIANTEIPMLGVSIGDAVTKIGSALATVTKIGAIAAASLAGVATKQYADYEQLIGGVETLFKNSASIVSEYAAKAYETAGLSSNQYMEQVTSFSASLLQGLGGDTAEAARIADMAMVDMADNANKMGTNISSIQDAYQGFAKQNYTMLDNLKLGYGGTASEMARLINDSGVLGDSMTVTAKTVNDVSFDKMIEAIHKIQENMDITGTTSKEAATTISGSFNSMKSAAMNLVTAMGGETNTAWGDALNALISTAKTFVTNLMPILTNALKGVGQLIKDVVPVIIKELPGLVSTVVPTLLEAIVSIISAVVDALPSLLNIVIDTIIAALPMIIDAIVTIVPQLLRTIVEIIIQIANKLTDPGMLNMILQGAIQLLMAIVDAIPEILVALIDALPQIIENIVGFLLDPNTIGMLISAAVDLFFGIVEAVPQILGSLLGAFGTLFGDLFNSLSGIFGETFGGIAEWFSGVWEGVKEIFGGVAEWFGGIFQGTVDVIMGIVNPIIEFFTGIWNGIVGIFSPIIEWFSSNVQIAWDNICIILEPVIGFFSNIWNSIVGIFSVVANWFSNMFNNAWNGIKKAFSTVGQFFSNAWNTIVGIFQGAAEWFGSIFTAAWEGIKNIFSPVGQFFQGIWDTIVNIFKNIAVTIGNMVSDIFKTAVNAVLTTAENILNAPIRAINGLIDVINAVPGISLGHLNELKLPRMEKGGIMPGNSYNGDNMLTRINSGEMVITRAQQASLWSAIENGDFGENGGRSNNNISFGDIIVNIQSDSEKDFDAEEHAVEIVKAIKREFVKQNVFPDLNNAGSLRR